MLNIVLILSGLLAILIFLSLIYYFADFEDSKTKRQIQTMKQSI